MRRVVNYHSSWARQQQVELLYASGNPGSTAGRVLGAMFEFPSSLVGRAFRCSSASHA
ncbi:hypothetical protein F511_21654 [Dorcoceras hygrometricum]|uniref:Uncharacterized protein n=1 Tax=Dorcoceras hygrometricum TaxID=472368 RepID=A0A2Z7AFN0_9LAMI|nr:hypothetical protein F511_21654 [Dorcoceras hygrometricum]